MLISFIILFTITSASALNNRPIIGIIAQKPHLPIPSGTSYLSASYVKFLESAGARVVPIPTNITTYELKKLFSYINGLLLPGGDADLMNSPYRTNSEIILNLALEAREIGDYFPIWGTCLGFQALMVMTAKSDDIISPSIGTEDVPITLNLTEEVTSSRMFADVPMEVLKVLETLNVTYNAHRNCVSVDNYRQNPKLNHFFRLLSMNNDKTGKIYASTIEARNYPFYAVQWHPEMNSYEFSVNEGLGSHINHSKEAVYITQYFANFFVNEARKSQHSFPSEAAEKEYLIYNYTPYHSGLHGWFSEQIYLF